MPLEKRASHQRSKTGCVPCKQRRIKCDEAHPQCMRCVKAKMQCEYITCIRPAGTAEKRCNEKRLERILLPKRAGEPSLTAIRPGSILPGETAVENGYMRYFERETTSDFPSLWDWSVWNRLMLQGCHHEAFIRDAVVAIGALHKSLRTEATGNSQELAKLQRQFAYQKYGRALKKIQHAIGTGAGPRDALIACLLVVCFELHSGDRYKAITHAYYGLSIYYELPLQDRPSKIEDDIADAFRNLDITASTIFDDRTVAKHEALLAEDDGIAAAMPSTFARLDEAKRYWHVIMRRCCHFIPTTWVHTDAVALIRPFRVHLPGAVTTTISTNIHTGSFQTTPVLEVQQAVYYAEVCAFIDAFAPVLQRIRNETDTTAISSPSLRAYIAATMLQIQALNAKVTLAGLLYVDEMGYDDHLDDFASMIHLSQSIVAIYNRNKKSASSCSYFSGLFSLDLGLVISMFTLLAKCRNHKLRQQGLEILKDWHVEGWWDPLLIAAIGRALIGVEEEGMVEGVIPKEARVTMTGKSACMPERRMVVQCVQRRKEGLRWVEKLVVW